MMGFLSSFLPPQVGALDDAVKNITEKLAAKGLFDDTLLIFTTGK
jgi:arylsulfatase A-like enzyme